MNRYLLHILAITLCVCVLTSQAWCQDEPAPAVAEPSPPPAGFTVFCKDRDLTIAFVSPTNVDADDNMSATISTHNFTKDLGIPLGGYSPFTDNTTGRKAVCTAEGRKIQAYPVDRNHILLFVGADRHPSIPDVMAFLIDTQTLTLVDTRNLGVSKDDDPAVIPIADGFKARMVIDSQQPGISCDCSASMLDAWMKIEIINNKLKLTWVKD
jgi:hypothetical protein